MKRMGCTPTTCRAQGKRRWTNRKGLFWNNELDNCPKGSAASSRSSYFKPPALPEVDDSAMGFVRATSESPVSKERTAFSNASSLRTVLHFPGARCFLVTYNTRSSLPEKLGCAMTAEGEVATGNYEVTNVPGVFVAGNASTSLLQLSIVAAAEGVEAAFGINQALLKEDLNK